METLAKRMTKYRLAAGLSVADVALALNISASTYRDWEHGRAIQGEPYEKIAILFNVSLLELLTGRKPTVEVHLQEIENAIRQIRTYLVEK